MKIKLALPLLLLLLQAHSFAQSDTSLPAKNSIYLEAAGTGGFGSINYERLVASKNKWQMALRSGLSTYNLRDFTNAFNPDLVLPMSLLGRYGKNHHFELGFGHTTTFIVQTNQSTWKPERTAHLHAHLILGYRYQKEQGGPMVRLSYTPLLEFYNHLRHWGGISLGHAF